MVDRLPSVLARIGNDPVAFAAKALAYACGCLQETRGFGRAGTTREFAQMLGVARGDHEHVMRGLRIEVVEGDDVFVAQHFARGNFFAHDFAKQTIAHDFGFISSQ